MLNPRSGNYGGGLRRLLRVPGPARASGATDGDFDGLRARRSRRRAGRVVTRRRRHRWWRRHRRRDRRGARPPGRVRRHRGPAASPSTARPSSGRRRGDHRRAHRRRRRAGPRASNVSVTDDDAVRALFAELVDEFGALDAVVNVAGISRPTGFATGSEDDWRGGARACTSTATSTCSRAALPIMAAAGHGRILGVTSGSGWRPADAGAYSCAKRAVAALTWQLGQATPPGVTVNAMSPIAATRMVLGALSRQAGAPAARLGRPAACRSRSRRCPRPSTSGRSAPTSWARLLVVGRGQIVFSNGAEVAWVVPPRLLEVARTERRRRRCRGCSSRSGRRSSRRPRPRRPATAAATRVSAPRSPTARPTADASAAATRAVVVTDEPARAATLTRRARGPWRRERGHRRARRRASPAPPSSWPRSRRRVRSDRRGGGRPRRRRELAGGRELGAGARRARRDHRADPHRRRVGARGVRLRDRRRPAGPGGQRRRRDHRRRSQPGPGGRAALAVPRTRRPTTGSTRSR